MSSTSNTRLLHVCTVGITARVFLLPIFRHLAANGFDVHFACTDDDDARYVAQEGFTFYPVTIPRGISPRDFLAFRRLTHIMRSQPFSLVNTHTSKAGFIGRMAAAHARIPCIVHTAHGTSFHPYRPALVNALYRRLERHAARHTDAFIAVTDTIRDTLITEAIAPPEKITTIPNGIDVDTFTPDRRTAEHKEALRTQWRIPHDACVICAVSRLVPHKGLEDLIDAFALCAQKYPHAYLVIAGDGPLLPALHTRVPAAVSSRIVWLGWTDDIPDILAAADIFCLPTLREGFGYVFLEAQAIGLPVITTRIAPLTETMQEDKTALFVPPRTPQMVADAMGTLIDNPAMRHEFGAAGRVRVCEKYARNTQCAALTVFYSRLCEKTATF